MSDPMRYTTRRRKISDAEIVAAYQETQDSDAVAFRAGCSGPTVLNIVRAAGLPVHPPGGRFGRRQTLAISDRHLVELYRAGVSAIEIAERAHCSPSTVYRILATHGVPRVGRG